MFWLKGIYLWVCVYDKKVEGRLFRGGVVRDIEGIGEGSRG